MSVIEIVSGVIMMLVCIVLTWIVLAQDSKGQGLSSVIVGTEMMSGESRAHSKEARQIRVTRILAVVFFVITIGVNVISALTA